MIFFLQNIHIYPAVHKLDRGSCWNIFGSDTTARLQWSSGEIFQNRNKYFYYQKNICQNWNKYILQDWHCPWCLLLAACSPLCDQACSLLLLSRAKSQGVFDFYSLSLHTIWWDNKLQLCVHVSPTTRYNELTAIGCKDKFDLTQTFLVRWCLTWDSTPRQWSHLGRGLECQKIESSCSLEFLEEHLSVHFWCLNSFLIYVYMIGSYYWVNVPWDNQIYILAADMLL